MKPYETWVEEQFSLKVNIEMLNYFLILEKFLMSLKVETYKKILKISRTVKLVFFSETPQFVDDYK